MNEHKKTIKAIKDFEENCKVLTKDNKTVRIRKYYNHYSVFFYYDGYPDYEWKRGSNGVSCDICDTLKQALNKARYYLNK